MMNLTLPKPNGNSITTFKKELTQDEIKLETYRFSNYLANAKKGADLKMLFGNYIHAGEISIVAGRSGVGKSILGYSLAHAISTGADLLGQKNECESLPVLYYDFELNETNIKKRFYNYEPNPNFFRPDISNILLENNGIFDFSIIEKDIELTGAKVLIIDNISALSLRTTSEANESLTIMKNSKLLQMKLGITIILLAHTPKLMENKPLELYQISGSSVLHNFIDSAVMIGKSFKNNDLRYIKQVKSRNSFENELVMDLSINAENWLHFDFMDFSDESSHISVEQNFSENKKDKFIEIADNLLKTKSLTYSEFIKKYADEYGKTVENGKKIFNQLKQMNLITKDGDGRKYIINQNERPF